MSGRCKLIRLFDSKPRSAAQLVAANAVTAGKACVTRITPGSPSGPRSKSVPPTSRHGSLPWTQGHFPRCPAAAPGLVHETPHARTASAIATKRRTASGSEAAGYPDSRSMPTHGPARLGNPRRTDSSAHTLGRRLSRSACYLSQCAGSSSTPSSSETSAVASCRPPTCEAPTERCFAVAAPPSSAKTFWGWPPTTLRGQGCSTNGSVTSTTRTARGRERIPVTRESSICATSN